METTGRRFGFFGGMMAFFGTLLVFGLIVGGCGISQYNHVVAMDQQVKGSWAQVENVLQRRYDLIPNLVSTVKGFAEHERGIIDDVAQARTKYFAAGTPEQKVDAANGVERALSRLLVLQEQYPNLKADRSFLQLQDELAGTENRIAVERQRYNESVQGLNTYIRGFFGRMVAGWAGVKEGAYFKPPEAAKEAPKVDFGRPEKP